MHSIWGSEKIVLSFELKPWRWRQNVPPKCWYAPITYSAISQKIVNSCKNLQFNICTFFFQLTSGPRNNTFQKTAYETDGIHSTYQKMSEPDLNATFLKVSDPCPLNRQKSVEMNATFQLSPRSRSITPSGLNCTFSIQEGGSNHSIRAASCDSGGDDDQFSSASDSSFSSSNRLRNVGDVQNIARLQEESKTRNLLQIESSSCLISV